MQSDLWSFESKAAFLPDDDCALPTRVFEEIADGHLGYEPCLQTMGGARLCADTGARMLLFCLGKSGNNAKSEMTRQLNAIAPEASAPIEKTLIVDTKMGKSGSSPTPELAMLRGMRILTLGDTCTNIKLNEGSIRRLVGGDVMYSRELNENPHPFTMLGKVTLNANNSARFDVTQEDLRGKIKMFPFTHKFEQNAETKALTESYRTTHLDEFFTYYARGAHDYVVNGLRTCEWLEGERAKFLVGINPIGEFIEEECVLEVHRVVDASGAPCTKVRTFTPVAALWKGYEAWVEGKSDDGQEIVTSLKNFGRLLTPIVGSTKKVRLNKEKEPRGTWGLWAPQNLTNAPGRQVDGERGRLGIRFKTAVEKRDRMDES